LSEGNDRLEIVRKVIKMGFIEIIELDENGVSVTDLSEASDSLRDELWLALTKENMKLESENK
jgi:metal-dependent hydrolase (beta-lactamase superfamily II)